MRGENYKMSPRGIARIVSFTLAIIAVLGGFVYVNYMEKENLKWQLQATYRQGFGDLVENLNTLSSTLQKGKYAQTDMMVSSLSTEITRTASLASAALSTLPFSTADLEQTAKFLSQVGDYAFYLSRNDAAGIAASDSEVNSMNELANTAYSLSLTLSELYYSLSEGSLDILMLSADDSEGHADAFSESVKQISSEFPAYGGLIYDGPFSEHLSTRSSGYLEDKKDVTANEAKAFVSKYFQINEKSIEYSGDSNGTIPSYCFTAKVSDGMLYADVSRKGGAIMSMSRDVAAGDAKMTAEECLDKARSFMKNMGFTDMVESYYHTAAGVVSVNFAAEQDGILCYPDLIKVAVSQATGAIVGLETSGYLMNHSVREFAAITVSREQAQEVLSKQLTVDEYKLALIPTPGQFEKLCHEFLCSDTEGQRYLVYVNVETGNEEQILILIEDENGTLTI